MEEKKYTGDGCLIVSELSRCPLFEADASTPGTYGEDCFFCKHSDFRRREYIERIANAARDGVLYSVCHHEKNKKSHTDDENKSGKEE